MSMEDFKRVLLGTTSPKNALAQLIAITRSDLRHVRMVVASIPDTNSERIAFDETLDEFADAVSDTEQKGVQDPRDALKIMKELGPQIAGKLEKVKQSAEQTATEIKKDILACQQMIAMRRNLVSTHLARNQIDAQVAQQHMNQLDSLEIELNQIIANGAPRDELRDMRQKKLLSFKVVLGFSFETVKPLVAKVSQVQEVFAEIRKARRNVFNDKKSVAFAQKLTLLEETLDELAEPWVNPKRCESLGIFAQVSQLVDVYKLSDVLEDANNLLSDVKSEANKRGRSSDLGTASRAMLQSFMAIPELEKRLGADIKDEQGRSPMDQARAVLEVFDDKFALLDVNTSPESKQANTAMRITAIITATSRSLARELNDPNLQPLIAKSLLKEYSEDISSTVAKQRVRNGDTNAIAKEQQNVAKSLKIAQALVLDDPVTKLVTGKMTLPDAVQVVRDMAELAGEKPSKIVSMLKEQFEAQIGSYSADELRKGQSGNEQGFQISDLYGELNPDTILGTELEQGIVHSDKGVTGDKYGLGEHGLRAGWDGASLDYTDDKKNLMDNFSTLVEAWDVALTDDDEFELSEEDIEEAQDLLFNSQEGARSKGQLPKIDAKALRQAAKNLKSPQGDNISAPGLGQDHEVRESLEDPGTKLRDKNRKKFQQLAQLDKELAELKQSGKDPTKLGQLQKKKTKLLQQLRAVGEKINALEQEALHGFINQRQYEHLRLVARDDDEEQDEFLKQNKLSMEDWVIEQLKERYGVDSSRATRLLKSVSEWMKSVPLTITFNAGSLFSDPGRNEPAYGPIYTSEVVHSRSNKRIEDVIGRGDQFKLSLSTAEEKLLREALESDNPEKSSVEIDTEIDKIKDELKQEIGVTGGKNKDAEGEDAGWVVSRGRNYLRWRKDKDDREAHLDHLAYEDQQVFGAANPNFDELKGGVEGKKTGENYYGDCHFLLADAVRSRSAFVVRGSGAVNPVQRISSLLLIYDMLKGSGNTLKYLDTLVLHAEKKDSVVATGLDWEVHIYGGFDMRKDAAAIYLPNDLDHDVKNRVERFAKGIKLKCETIEKKPLGLEVLNSANPKTFALDA